MTKAQRNQRIAVLVSGQVRSDESDLREIVKSCEEIGADIFLSLWKKRGVKGFGGGQGLTQLARVFGNELALVLPRYWIGSNMRKVFTDTRGIIPDLGELNIEKLATILPGAHIAVLDDREDLSTQYMDSNSLRMLYMIDHCNQMKQAKEADQDFKYDIVVRHRPDIKLNYRRAIEVYSRSGKTVVPRSDDSKPHQLHDIFWVASSAVDDTLSALYGRAKQTQESGWNGIHVELKNWTVENQIDVVKENIVVAGIDAASFSAVDTQRLSATNFVDAVFKRKLDVESAGGELLCATFEPVFSAVVGGTRPVSEQIENILPDIAAQKIRPKIMLNMLQALGWRGVFDTKLTSRNRLQLFLLNLAIDDLTRNSNACEWSAGRIFEHFADSIPNTQLIRWLLDSNLWNRETSGFLQSLCDSLCEVAKVSRSELHDLLAKMQVLAVSHQSNWRWMLFKFTKEEDEELIVQLAEAQLRHRVYARPIVNLALSSKICRINLDRRVAILSAVAELADSAAAYGELAKSLLEIGKVDIARQSLEKASQFTTSPKWVAQTLQNLSKE